MSVRAPFAWLAAIALLAPAACTPAKKSDLPIMTTVACNEIHEILRAMPFEKVTRSTVAVAHPLTARENPGCLIAAQGSRQRLADLDRTSATSPGDRLKELLPSRGWREDARFAQGKPGSDAFAFARGGVVCYFAARWSSPGDDVDPAALPPDRYRIDARCTVQAEGDP